MSPSPPAEPAARYAFYFAPEPGHPLWEAGCTWLLRDPSRPERRFAEDGVPQRDWIEAPRRYGFHATLKAPMRLRDPAARGALVQAAARLARAHMPFRVPALGIALHRGFLALQPLAPLSRHHPLHRLADGVVTGLDAFRAPPSPEERARQQGKGLAPRQQALFERWGYPWVLDAWRFHITLSDELPPQQLGVHARLRQLARAHFAAALAEPLVCRSLCLFEQAAPGEPFVLSERLPFGG
ncbi:DUF1045 domain-containing protein [Caldimonas tepidiphila]|uniref:DUF1045 domain-containing protein n=1 Tax=Caldimonas tepidiphila TaxID=2315841 RepID=UPI000E5AB106|nr:DUF1045 domain-containing protein [Caldimonas tepidiphila]